MKIINMISNYDIVLSILGINYEIDKDRILELKMESNENVFIGVYPCVYSSVNKSIPYIINLKNLNNKIFCDNQNISQIDFANRTEFFLEPMFIKKNLPEKKSKFTISGTTINALCSLNQIVVETNKNKNYYDMNFLEEPTIFNTSNCLFVLGKENNTEKTLIAYLPKPNKFFKFSGEQIEQSGNKLKVLKKIVGIAKHSQLCEYDISENDIDLKNTELFYNQTTAQSVSARPLIPYAFFEAVMNQDYSLAQSYLTPQLTNFLTTQTLKNYFGNIEKIRISSLQPLTYCTYENSSGREYIITMLGEKISEIEEKN